MEYGDIVANMIGGYFADCIFCISLLSMPITYLSYESLFVPVRCSRRNTCGSMEVGLSLATVANNNLYTEHKTQSE